MFESFFGDAAGKGLLLRMGWRKIVLITFVFDSLYQWTLVLPLAFVLSRFTALPILPMYIAVQCMEFTKCFLGYFLVKRRKWVRDLVNGNA